MSHQFVFILAIVTSVFSCSWSSITADSQQAIKRAPAFSAEMLATLPTTGWLTNGGDLFNRRFSPLTQINRRNVAELKAVWRKHLDGSGIGPQFSGEAQPIIHEGVIYVITGADDVFAITVESGELLWKYEAHIDTNINTVCCGWTSRGVALGDGKIYVGQLDSKLLALDQTNGKVIWSIQAERWQEGYTITSAPLYFNGLVITGFAGADYGTRGRVKAYDATDGSLVWTFYSIPGPGKPGHDTWPGDNDIWKHGGGAVWQTPAVDPDLGLIYFSTGNPGPDFNGAVRQGDNLYTDSIVALEVESGKYRWHFQQVHHDIWDYDSANPVVLFDIEVEGTTRKALAQVNKNGWIYILNRKTGQPLIGIEERTVMQEPRQFTSATQPYPVGEAVVPQTIDIAPENYELVNQGHIFTPFWTEPTLVKRAGANWPPSAYDLSSQILYVCASERIWHYRVNDQVSESPPEGSLYFGGNFGSVSLPAAGIFAAMDMKTNRIVWRQRWPDKCYSGVTATAGGLLFVGRNDGRLTALDSSDGRRLWEFNTGAGVNAPASVFKYNGQQYVVVLSAGNLFAGSKRGDSVWLFSLTGTMSEVTPPDTVQVTQIPSSDPGTGSAQHGRDIFARACQFCHGPRGEGAHSGAVLSTSTHTSLSVISQNIRDGKNQMPAFGAMLNPSEIESVARYVLELKTE